MTNVSIEVDSDIGDKEMVLATRGEAEEEKRMDRLEDFV